MIDLQINGLTTKDFSCNFWACPSDQEIKALAEYQYSQGITSFLATLITDNPDAIEKQLSRIADYKKNFDNDFEQAKSTQRAHLIGVHLEGGMISRYGVHPREYSSALNYKSAQHLLKTFPALIKLWTLCPRMDQNGELTKFLQDSGIVVSYGHSEASYEEGMNAFAKFGVNLVTHWGNAMFVAKNFSQRNPSKEDLELLKTNTRNQSKLEDYGIGLAALDNANVFCLLICGSIEDHDLHLDPQIIKLIAEKKPEKLILVSDSVAYQSPNAPTSLVGGLNTLKKHSANAFRAGLNVEHIEKATSENPSFVLGLST